MRVLVAWCPDWPVTAAGLAGGTAAGLDLEQALAVVAAGRVHACSAAARGAGVGVDMRRREAEGRCPGLVVLDWNPGAETRAFEPVVAAIATLTPLVEVTRPGLCALDVRGPARYFGGEEELCRRVVEVVAGALGTAAPAVLVGVADGYFAATLAARRGVIVPVGGSREFLAPFPVSVLGRPELADILGRLGVHTLGAFAALPAPSVLSRFGSDGAAAQCLAAAMSDRRLRAQVPAEPAEVLVEFDPPVERVDVAAFSARSMATDLVEHLSARGLACVRIRIEAETEHGESLARTWRGEGALSAEDIVTRLRWQLDGWLSASAGQRPTAGITRLALVADQVLPAYGRQLALWGEHTDADRRAARALDRLRGMLGPDAIFRGALSGGRGPADRVVLVPWGEPAAGAGSGRPPAEPAGAAEPAAGHSLPWPGQCPGPAPSTIFPKALPAALVDRDSEAVTVDARGRLSGAPARLALAGGAWVEVVGWAGPWLADERWWDRSARCRRARFQVLRTDGVAHLIGLEGGRWSVEATYD
ncbi:MAG: DNA polymerase Y family protein [Acidimicrobiales bacterium]